MLLEFLYVEHHTKLQGLLALFALPIERRVASGASLLLEALEDAAGGRCRFRIRFDLAGLDPAPALQQMGPEEGDWMVIGPANDQREAMGDPARADRDRAVDRRRRDRRSS